MNDYKVVALVSLTTYGLFFIVILLLALFLSSEEQSDYAQAWFLIFTTFFAGSWGHILPAGEVGRAVCSLTAMVGYMCPLLGAFFMFVCMDQESLALMAGKGFCLAYFCTALLANFILAAGLSVDCVASHSTWMSDQCGYGSQLYFAWMTFHLRAYGKVAPTGPVSNVISLVIVMFGSLCWVVPLFSVARKTLLDPGAQLFSSGPEGTFRPWCCKAFKAVVLPYLICFGIILLFSIVWATMCSGGCSDAECIDCDFGNVFHVLLSTFHGATWGHLYPSWPVEQFLACVVASMGYLWRQVVLLLLLRQIDQHRIAGKYAKALLVTYFLFAVLGNLIVAGLNMAAAVDGEDWGYGNFLYYTWMSYHGRVCSHWRLARTSRNVHDRHRPSRLGGATAAGHAQFGALSGVKHGAAGGRCAGTHGGSGGKPDLSPRPVQRRRVCPMGSCWVLSAVLQDAAGSNFGLSGSVAQMEEAVLRLLVLHKELAGQAEAPHSALADATAGLAPRMLQVLQAAKAVCEANRSKLKAYTEEKQLGIDRSDYLMPQMRAIDRLQQQFSSLMPGQEVHEDKCECGAEFTADAKFCRLCGRRRQTFPGAGTPRASLTAPSSARFSPRTEAPRDFTSMASQLHHLQAPSLSSSPPSARRQSLGYVARNEVTRPDRPVDPGLPDSQLPALRGGSPPVKPRRSVDGAGVATPRSEVSSVAAPWSGPEYRVRRVNVPAIPHWERQHLAKVGDGAGSSAMWDAVAATVKTSPRPAAVADGPVEPISAEVSPLWDAVAGVACGSQLRSPRTRAKTSKWGSGNHGFYHQLQAVGAPLRTAVQQVRGVANELSRRGRGAGGGAHAGAGSPSPRQEPHGSTERPPEDKYLKILQSLQAKGAMNGGLAAQLLEKQGLRRRIRGIQDADTDSESSDLR
eukprot:s41_g7.t1